MEILLFLGLILFFVGLKLYLDRLRKRELNRLTPEERNRAKAAYWLLGP